jgi:hypothetical protein
VTGARLVRRRVSDGRRLAVQEGGEARPALVAAAFPQLRLQLPRPSAAKQFGMPCLRLELGLAQTGEILMNA